VRHANARAPQRVLVMGGTSEIALATIRALPLASHGELVLAGRDPEALEAAAAALPPRWRTTVAVFDARRPESALAVVDATFAAGDVDLVLPAFGVLGSQDRSENDPMTVVDQLTVNVTTQAVVLLESARRMRDQGHGTICVLSSIAGVRTRRANFVYGAAKAALDGLGTGTGLLLEGSGARVLVVRPGFVRGRMTAGMAPAPFACTPDDVGHAIAGALRSGRRVVWVPRGLVWLGWVMRLTPQWAWVRVRR
jgi:decaprenylphospho-beta-D-erythro-pentofuranosid-2-ulose 2-reductase